MMRSVLMLVAFLRPHGHGARGRAGGVHAFAQADPAVKAGVLTYEIRPWLIGMRK